MEFVLPALPFLLFLACPLMMIFCVVGMRKSGCSTSSVAAEDTSIQPRDARVAALEGQLAMIQTELQTLRTEDGKPTPDKSPGMDGSRVDHQPEVNHAAQQFA